MSQAGALTAAGSTPSIPTSFVLDTGSATPSDNILEIKSGVPLSTNSTNGITTSGVSTRVVTIQLTNSLTGTGTANNDDTEDLITFDLGASPAVYRFEFEVAGRETTTGDGVGYKVYATARTTGSPTNVATIIASTYSDNDEDDLLVDAEIDVVASGNDIILQVTGVTGTIITYVSTGSYVVA